MLWHSRNNFQPAFSQDNERKTWGNLKDCETDPITRAHHTPRCLLCPKRYFRLRTLQLLNLVSIYLFWQNGACCAPEQRKNTKGVGPAFTQATACNLRFFFFFPLAFDIRERWFPISLRSPEYWCWKKQEHHLDELQKNNMSLKNNMSFQCVLVPWVTFLWNHTFAFLSYK